MKRSEPKTLLTYDYGIITVIMKEVSKTKHEQT